MEKTQEEYTEFINWLNIGIEKNWITEPFCYTHDGDPYMSKEEAEDWENGGDPCCHVVKFTDNY